MNREKIILRDIAYARSGDKGSSVNIGVIAYTQIGYEFLKLNLLEGTVQHYFLKLGLEKTTRFELDNLMALNFVLDGILSGGASRSLRLDSQGKALGQALLEMELLIDVDILPHALKV